jgi:membrane protein implicated in regulation of membrane protease activity
MPSTENQRRPSALVWCAALASLLMPIAGVALSLYGVFKITRDAPIGWVWLALGLALLIADLVIDHKWSRRVQSSEPDLNRRGEQLVGQVVTVVEAIPRDGRGSVRAADTVWVAEGAEAASGARVRITGCKGMVLTVEAS